MLNRLADYGLMEAEVLKPALDCLRRSGFDAMATDLVKGRPLALFVTIYERADRKLSVVAEVGVGLRHEPPPHAEEVFSFHMPLYRLAVPESIH